VLIQIVNAGGNGVGESELSGDIGSAFATNLDQRARILLLGRGNLEQLLHSLQKRHAGSDVRQCILQAFPSHARPILCFQVALGSNFVRVQDVKEPGGIAAASCIFEQERVIKVGLVGRAHANLLCKPHPDHARSNGMSHGLAFGQVEGVGKSGNDFRQQDRGGCLIAFNARKPLRMWFVRVVEGWHGSPLLVPIRAGHICHPDLQLFF
jgi:hypothetical protein